MFGTATGPPSGSKYSARMVSMEMRRMRRGRSGARRHPVTPKKASPQNATTKPRNHEEELIFFVSSCFRGCICSDRWLPRTSSQDSRNFANVLFVERRRRGAHESFEVRARFAHASFTHQRCGQVVERVEVRSIELDGFRPRDDGGGALAALARDDADAGVGLRRGRIELDRTLEMRERV